MAASRKPEETPESHGSRSAVDWATERRRTRVSTALWRRVTALFSLGVVSIVIGVALAGVLAVTALLLLVALDRAVGT
jgi:hypothetical protein